MNQENILTIDIKSLITKVFQFSIFVAIAVTAPYFLNQLVTGSIVNALLFIAVFVLGIESALLLCFIPSIISIYTGLLPTVLIPMIPFIIIGNVLLVLTFYFLRKKEFLIGVIPAILIKFLFIFVVGNILASTILNGIASKVILMVSWPQLATATAGACIAFLFLKIFQIKNINK